VVNSEIGLYFVILVSSQVLTCGFITDMLGLWGMVHIEWLQMWDNGQLIKSEEALKSCVISPQIDNFFWFLEVYYTFYLSFSGLNDFNSMKLYSKCKF
jgi:hypothetical protein